MLQSLEIEKYCISLLLNYPTLIADVEPYTSDSSFTSKFHKVAFSLLKRSIGSGEKPDKFLLAKQIQDLNISFENSINPVDYIEALASISVDESNGQKIFKELHKITKRREMCDAFKSMSSYVEKANEDPLDTIIANCDKTYSDLVNNFSFGNEPIDLFKTAQTSIEERSKTDDGDEIANPYPNCQKMFGGYFPGDLVIYASRAKSGKSTLLLDIMTKCCAIQNNNVRGLIIDTELETYRVQRRAVASIAGINEYYLKSNKWRNNKELYNRVLPAWEIVKSYFNKLDHIYVGNCTIEEMVSLIKRWHWKKVKGTNYKGLVAVDYFKMTKMDGSIKDAFQTSLNLGQKVDTLKKLASELQIRAIAACQTNRTNEERKDSSKRTDSGSAIGLSDGINQFASSVFVFQRKAADELTFNSKASHHLTQIYGRDQGEQAQGFNDLVKIQIEKGKYTWRENYVNFKIDNFAVKELNTLKDEVANQLSIGEKPTESAELI